jgi:hypothetical protein
LYKIFENVLKLSFTDRFQVHILRFRIHGKA